MDPGLQRTKEDHQACLGLCVGSGVDVERDRGQCDEMEGHLRGLGQEEGFHLHPSVQM